MSQQVPLQDIDLLARMNQYLDSIGAYLREGRGWLIFNAQGQRSSRITKFLLDALTRKEPRVGHYFVPWRDFALNAYMVQVELAGHRPDRGEQIPSSRLRREYEIANNVTFDQLKRMTELPLVILSGVAPHCAYEVRYLDSIVEVRHRTRLATVLITPRSMEELSSDFRATDEENDPWSRFFERMYQSSLIAL
ncbi:MAG: hypothetical protein HYX94_02370 [Chloroflexi bacterium]|nr:hypothetical protein [Chloroflexota bacterium]